MIPLNKAEKALLTDYQDRKKFNLNMTSQQVWHLAQLEARAAKEEIERPKKLKQVSLV